MKLYQWRITSQSWFALLALVLVSWLIIANVALIFELTWILFGAFILSVMIRPAANRLARWRIPRGATVLMAYVLLIVGIIVIFRLTVPVLGVEATTLRQSVPTMTQQAMGRVAKTPLAHWLPSTDNLAQAVDQQVSLLFMDALSTVAGFGSFLLNLFVVLILGYFFATATLDEEQPFWQWLTPAHRAHLRTISTNIYRRLTRWVWTQLILGGYHALCFVVGLLLLQVPFALTIGLLGGLLSLIPYLGVLLAIALAAATVLATDPWLALWVTIYLSAISIIGAHIVTPVLYGRAVGLNSIVVLIALFVGAQLQGILGMIFAIPIAVIIDTVLQEFALTPVADGEEVAQ